MDYIKQLKTIGESLTSAALDLQSILDSMTEDAVTIDLGEEMKVEEEKKVEEVKVKKIGSREEVFNGQAVKTRGGLVKDDLVLSKKGKVVSKKMQERGKVLLYSSQQANEKKRKLNE